MRIVSVPKLTQILRLFDKEVNLTGVADLERNVHHPLDTFHIFMSFYALCKTRRSQKLQIYVKIRYW